MGLNVAAEQFPPVWGAVVKLAPNWGCWVGAELGVPGDEDSNGTAPSRSQCQTWPRQVIPPSMWAQWLVLGVCCTPGCWCRVGCHRCAPGAVSRASGGCRGKRGLQQDLHQDLQPAMPWWGESQSKHLSVHPAFIHPFVQPSNPPSLPSFLHPLHPFLFSIHPSIFPFLPPPLHPFPSPFFPPFLHSSILSSPSIPPPLHSSFHLSISSPSPSCISSSFPPSLHPPSILPSPPPSPILPPLHSPTHHPSLPAHPAASPALPEPPPHHSLCPAPSPRLSRCLSRCFPSALHYRCGCPCPFNSLRW